MANDGPKHKLVAILAADIVGFSRMMEADQTGTHSQLGACRKEVVNPAIEEHGGRTFKTMGDGFLVEFASPLNAVRCALAIQQDMARRNAHVPEDSRIVFRIGVNLGDVIIEGDDLYGNGVNIAARLESICDPGGVFISGKVHDEVSGETGLKFTDRGPQTVKNISKPVQAFAVELSEGAVSAVAPAPQPSRLTPSVTVAAAILVAIVGVFAWQTTRDSGKVADSAIPVSGKPSIAVLAFSNLTGDPNQEYFRDGVTEDIITELARRHDLSVIARNSSFFFKDQAIDIREVAQELGVQYVVEGSVQRSGDTLRVTAQLIDGSTGNHLWAETYERRVVDVFEVQKDIVRNIVGVLLGEIKAAEMTAAFRNRTDNLQAYELVKLGNFYTNQAYVAGSLGDPESLEAALLGKDAYERAIELDPGYSDAYVFLVHNMFRSLEPWPDDAYDQMTGLIETALALDPTNAYAYSKLATVLVRQGRPDEALASAKRGNELDPNDAEGWWLLSDALWASGMVEEALDSVLIAIRLNPRAPVYYYNWISGLNYEQGDYQAALEAAQDGVRLYPANRRVNMMLLSSLVRLGKIEEAHSAAERSLDDVPDFGPRYSGLAAFKFHFEAERQQIYDDLRSLGIMIPEDETREPG